jgi:hypothetical protein
MSSVRGEVSNHNSADFTQRAVHPSIPQDERGEVRSASLPLLFAEPSIAIRQTLRSCEVSNHNRANFTQRAVHPSIPQGERGEVRSASLPLLFAEPSIAIRQTLRSW